MKIIRTIQKKTQCGISGYTVEISEKYPTAIAYHATKGSSKLPGAEENVLTQVFLSEPEYKIRMFIQELNIVFPDGESKNIIVQKLWNLIEDYGQMKYSEGYDEGYTECENNSNPDY